MWSIVKSQAACWLRPLSSLRGTFWLVQRIKWCLRICVFKILHINKPCELVFIGFFRRFSQTSYISFISLNLLDLLVITFGSVSVLVLGEVSSEILHIVPVIAFTILSALSRVDLAVHLAILLFEYLNLKSLEKPFKNLENHLKN